MLASRLTRDGALWADHSPADSLLKRLSRSNSPAEVFAAEGRNLLDWSGATGIVICVNRQKHSIGTPPDIGALNLLIEWFEHLAPRDHFVADDLHERIPGGVTSASQRVYAAPIEAGMENYVMWFSGQNNAICGDELQEISLAIVRVMSMPTLGQAHGLMVPRGVAVRMNGAGQYLHVGDESRDLFGYAPNDLEGHPLIDFVYSGDSASVMQYLAQAAPRAGRSSVFRHACNDGSYVWVRSVLRDVDDSDDLSLVLLDISGQQKGNESFNQPSHLLVDEEPRKSQKGVITLTQDGVILFANEDANILLAGGGDLCGKHFCEDVCVDRLCSGCPQQPRSIADRACVRRNHTDLRTNGGALIPVTLWAIDAEPAVAGAPSSVVVFQLWVVGESPEVGIFLTDRNGRIGVINSDFAAITGYSSDDVIGQTPAILKSGVHSKQFYRSFWHELAEQRSWHGMMWNRRKSGEQFGQTESIYALETAQGEICNYLAILRDSARSDRPAERAHQVVGYDPLTGLPGRVIFERTLSNILDAPSPAPCAVVLLSLNKFRLVNEALGHVSADRLLYKVTDRLASSLRREDVLAHWGGDHFAMLLPDVKDEAQAGAILGRLLSVLEAPFAIGGREIIQSATAGIAIAPRDGRNTETILCAANAALNLTKAIATHNFGFFRPDSAASVRDRFNLSHDLRPAFNRGEISVVYQPQVDAKTGTPFGFEALARWDHPRLGPVAPQDFISVAEDYELMIELGASLFNMVCAQVAAWRNTGEFNFTVSINVAPQQIKLGFPRFVRDALIVHGVPPRMIVIEVTESILKPSSDTFDIMRDLRDLGVSLAIDDFGTGYSSLSHLKHFPFDCLKIDKSFIDGVPGCISDNAITHAVIALGHALSKNVLAEGVETEEQAAFLRASGVNSFQGYLFSRPIPAQGVLPYLEAFCQPAITQQKDSLCAKEHHLPVLAPVGCTTSTLGEAIPRC